MMSQPEFVLANRRLTARFDPRTGNLLSLTPARLRRSLVKRATCRFTIDDHVDFEEQMTVDAVTAAGRAVTSTLRTRSSSSGGAAVITRRFELGRDDPLLRVSYDVTGATSRSIELGIPAAPRIEFGDGFVNVFEDDRDLYFDGAELGDGRELPCWRVFFREGHRDGLLVATRSKLDMSRFQIMADAFELKPHVMTAYDTDYTLWQKPIVVRRGVHVQARFEIGPWRRSAHQALLRRARLHQPSAHRNRPEVGARPKRKLKGRVFPAVKLAASSMCGRTCKRGKWQIVPLPWTRSAQVLFANSAQQPPAISLNPKLRGVYRVFAGLGNGSGIVLRFAGEPEPVHRLSDLHKFYNSRTPFHLRLSGRQRCAEVSCGTHELDGRPIRVEAPANPHQPAMLDYLRFEKLSPAQERRWRDRRDNPPVIALQGFADIPDIAHVTAVTNPGPEPYRANIWAHGQAGMTRVCWRIDGQCTDYPSRVNTMRYPSAKVHGVFNPQAKAYGRALRRFDMLKLAVDAGRKYGLEIYGWMRFNNYGGNVQSDFFKEHPEFHETWEHGTKARKLCLAIPEVRKHKRDILVEAAGYGLDGLNLGFLRHPPILLYHPVLVEGYRRQYGVEPPRVTGHPDATHLHTEPECDAEHMRWYHYRAQFMTQFGRELRADLRERGLGHVKIAIWVRANLRCLFDGIDIDAWLDEGLCDEVVVGATTAGFAEAPGYDPDARWRGKVQSRAKLVRGLFCHDANWLKRQARKAIDEGYDGINTYESNVAALNDRIIAVYDSLRR